jgi:hypothetical protein
MVSPSARMDAPDAKSPDPTPPEGRPSKAVREDRLAKALRENLRRRKALSRGSGHGLDPD